MAAGATTSVTGKPVRVKTPGFYKITPTPTTKSSGGSNLPLYSVLILLGVAVVFVLRNRQTVINGPVLTLIPSNDTDASAYANLTQGINALAGNVYLSNANPSGGASTPITANPNA